MRPSTSPDRPPDSLRGDYCFEGKVVVVTGASAGCGFGIARAFACHKARVILIARAVEALESAASDIRAEGGDVGIASCDVTDPESVRREISALPRLDVLINNAGT